MTARTARDSCEGEVVRIVLGRKPLVGSTLEPAQYKNSIVVLVDAGDHPWAGKEMPVPRKHARTEVSVGDRVRLLWPEDSRRTWPDIYRIAPA